MPQRLIGSLTTTSLTEWVTCAECDGYGEVEVEYWQSQSFNNPYGEAYTAWEECDECKGSGRVQLNPEDSE